MTNSCIAPVGLNGMVVFDASSWRVEGASTTAAASEPPDPYADVGTAMREGMRGGGW